MQIMQPRQPLQQSMQQLWCWSLPTSSDLIVTKNIKKAIQKGISNSIFFISCFQIEQTTNLYLINFVYIFVFLNIFVFVNIFLFVFDPIVYHGLSILASSSIQRRHQSTLSAAEAALRNFTFHGFPKLNFRISFIKIIFNRILFFFNYLI